MSKKTQMLVFPKIRVYTCLFALFFSEFLYLLCVFLYIWLNFSKQVLLRINEKYTLSAHFTLTLIKRRALLR